MIHRCRECIHFNSSCRASECKLLRCPIEAQNPICAHFRQIPVTNADTLVVYGDVYGDVINCGTVVLINGNVHGQIKDCNIVAGYLANNPISDIALQNKLRLDEKISREDLGFSNYTK